MTTLANTLKTWQTDAFAQTLKREITALPSGSLPLDKALNEGGYVDDSNLEISILSTSDNHSAILIKAGVFFSEIVICCGCGDDPMPKNVYCEILISIDKKTAGTVFEIIQDQHLSDH